MSCMKPPTSIAMKHTLALSALLCCGLSSVSAWAHEGHGLPGIAHWHGTDVLGFVGAIAVAAAIWFKGRK